MHTIPIKPENYEEDGAPFQACIFFRSLDCELLCGNISSSNCIKQDKSVSKQKEKHNVQPPQPLKDKAPLSKSSKERLVATVQRQRVVCKESLGIMTSRDVAPQSIEGNVSGRHSGKRSKWCNVSEELLPKTNKEIVILNML